MRVSLALSLNTHYYQGMGSRMVKVACTIVDDGPVYVLSNKLHKKIRAPSSRAARCKTTYAPIPVQRRTMECIKN